MIKKTTYSGLWVFIKLTIHLPFINWEFHQLHIIFGKECVIFLEQVFIRGRHKLYDS